MIQRRTKAISISAFAVAFLWLAHTSVMAQYLGTLYSPYKVPDQKRDLCLNFQTGLNTSKFGPCDLRYGFLGIDNDFDWLQVGMSQDVRSVIKDLGPRSWNDSVDAPVVAPLPKLKPGQKRMVSIDASGADGGNRHNGPKVDPAFTRAIVGHMYVVHVVDEVSDYYALFRVDALEDRTCTISWKLIPTPQK